jgi:hypothetical protein
MEGGGEREPDLDKKIISFGERRPIEEWIHGVIAIYDPLRSHYCMQNCLLLDYVSWSKILELSYVQINCLRT